MSSTTKEQEKEKPFNSFEKVSVFARHKGTSAPSSIYVQPQAVLLADVGNAFKRIHGSQNGRSGSSRHHEGQSILAQGPFNFTPQVINIHLSSRINIDQIEVVGADSQKDGRFLDGIVSVSRGQCHKATRAEGSRFLIISNYSYFIFMKVIWIYFDVGNGSVTGTVHAVCIGH